MKMSCLPVSYFPEIIEGRMTIGSWAKEAAGLGLDAIDLSSIFFQNSTDEDLRKVRREIEKEGIRVLVLNTYPDFTHPDKRIRRKELSKINDNIRTAGLLGAGIVRVTAGQAHPGTEKKEGIRLAAEGLLSLEETAKKNSVTLALENHSKPGVWDYFDFAYPTDIFLEIAGKLQGSAVKVLFDTANTIAYGDDPLTVLEKVYDRVVCIHAADTVRKGSFKPAFIGKGAVPFIEIFRFLKKAGYSGWLSIEEASGKGKRGIEGAVNFIRETWDHAQEDI